jgi:hypothetical protein
MIVYTHAIVAVKETLAADVRSSFQTRRGAPVALPPALLGKTGRPAAATREGEEEIGRSDVLEVVDDVAEGEELKLPFDEVTLYYKWVAARPSEAGVVGMPVLVNANGGVGHIEVTNVTLPDTEDVSRVHGVSRRELVVERLPPSLLEEVGGRFEGEGDIGNVDEEV